MDGGDRGLSAGLALACREFTVTGLAASWEGSATGPYTRILSVQIHVEAETLLSLV